MKTAVYVLFALCLGGAFIEFDRRMAVDSNRFLSEVNAAGKQRMLLSTTLGLISRARTTPSSDLTRDIHACADTLQRHVAAVATRDSTRIAQLLANGTRCTEGRAPWPSAEAVPEAFRPHVVSTRLLARTRAFLDQTDAYHQASASTDQLDRLLESGQALLIEVDQFVSAVQRVGELQRTRARTQRAVVILAVIAALIVLGLLGAPGAIRRLKLQLVEEQHQKETLAQERQHLREIRAHLEEAERIAQLGSWTRELPSGRETWSRELYSIFGVDPEGDTPDYAYFLESIHPEDRAAVEAQVSAALACDEPYDTTFRIRQPSGEERIVRARGRVERDARGAPIMMTGAVLDVSGQVRLETRLRSAERLEAVGQLAGGVAHDVNNLLMVIRGTSELLASSRPDDREIQDYGRQIDEVVESAARVTGSLLSFAQRQPLTPRQVDLRAHLEEFARAMNGTIGRRHVVEFEQAEASPLYVHIDIAQLDVALLNLVLNARDALPGGGSISLVGPVHVHGEQGPMTEIRIIDRGTGMDRSTRDRVLEPFFTTKDRSKGHGLGLSRVYGFVEQSGGSMQIESAIGAGTTIRLAIPCIARAVDENRAA